MLGFAASRGVGRVLGQVGVQGALLRRCTRRLGGSFGIRCASTMKAATLISVDPSVAPASLAGPNPVFAQCMLRISDMAKSREFYEEKLGMKFLAKLDFDDLRFSLLFFAFTEDDVPSPSVPQAERASWLWSRPYPTMELTYNWPSESEVPEKLVNGNLKPDRGFGHTGFLVDDAHDFVKRAEESGCKVVRPTGPFLDIATMAFVEDPDSYWLEIIQKTGSKGVGPEVGMAGKSPVFAQTMLRVNDPTKSVEFFQRLGMKYVGQIDVPEFEFSLYFLAYTNEEVPPDSATRKEKSEWLFKMKECTIELTHNWMDDGENSEVYTNGNEKGRRGFGHVGITVDSVPETTKKMAAAGYDVVRDVMNFKDVATISFVASPEESYWVELIQRSPARSS